MSELTQSEQRCLEAEVADLTKAISRLTEALWKFAITKTGEEQHPYDPPDHPR